MIEVSRSEVNGNTAQGRDNTMFNGPAELGRRVLEGNSARTGDFSIVQHFHGARGFDAALCSRDATPTRGEVASMSDIPASMSQMGSGKSVSLPPQSDGTVAAALAVWNQQSERYRDEARRMIECIQALNSEISENFHTLGDQNTGLTEFTDYEVLFELTVNGLQLIGRVEEICRIKWTPISPPARVNEVEDITARLLEILNILQEANSHFINSLTYPSLEPKNLRPRKHRNQAFTSSSGRVISSQSGIRKPNSKPRYQHHSDLVVCSTKGLEGLKSRMRLLRGLTAALQEVLMIIKPPGPDRSFNIELPKELKVARFAAGMLYKSLGNLCPNPDHGSHDVLFRLATEESVFPEGKGEFRLRVAFEGSSDCPTWFDINSVVELREAALDGNNDDMDLDDKIPVDIPDHRQHELLPGTSISPIRNHMPRLAGEHTARFCLYNHRQQVYSSSLVAAELRDSEACTHIFYYPKIKDSQSPHDSSEILSLYDSLHRFKRLNPRQKVRLARIISESLLKFDSSDWLRCDLDTRNILVYSVKETLEPHLRIRLQSPTEHLTSGFGRSASEVLEQLSKIMCEIAISPQKFTKMPPNPRRLYAEVEKRLNKSYVSVVKHCVAMADEWQRRTVTQTEKTLLDDFYGKVVSSLRDLEDGFPGTKC